MKAKTFFIGLATVVFSLQLHAQCNSSKSQTAHASNVKYYEGKHKKDIVDTAASLEMFSTLVTAVKTAGLVETLKGEGPFTVFAPTNAAFAKLPEATVKRLLAPAGKKQLTKILTYHVVAGEFKAKDVIAAIKASKNGSFAVKTVSGDTLKASISNGKVVLTDENGGSAVVTKTDVSAANGVIHVIDAVVLPK